MENFRMFCYQCEQTSHGTGCTGPIGVCGKKPDTSSLQDKLTGAVISLAECIGTEKRVISYRTTSLIIESLYATMTNVNFNPESIERLFTKVCREAENYCEKDDFRVFDITDIWKEEESVKSLKSLLLFGLRGMAAYAYNASHLGYMETEINRFFVKALCVIGSEKDSGEILDTVIEAGKVNYLCMKLLDKANTDVYGIPVPTKVKLTIDPGPFIVVSGHDLSNLHRLLQETVNRGVKVYSHGEMLPAHGYPNLRKYGHLKGNFGTAWQNQQKEFEGIPAPVVFTSNCIMPPRLSYADRVFTTGAVDYPGCTHLSGNESFSPVISKALELGGYSEKTECRGINGGTEVITGWSYRSVLNISHDISEKIREGKISHIFVVGGCDGAKPGRNYYTDFVRNIPDDAVVFTLACGKYRFNDIDLGNIDNIPRLMDLGQCNDAYGLIQVLLSLTKELNCNVNDLPLSIVLSWYEQKAVSVLLTLLSLGIKNILIGPSLPACVTPYTLKLLNVHYGLTLIKSPEEDIQRLLKAYNRKKEFQLENNII